MDNHSAYEHVRLLLASGEEAEAVRVYERLLITDPEAKELLVPVAAMLLEQGRSTLAIRLAEGILEDDPWLPSAHQVRVDALAEAGAIEDSAQAAEEWAAATPEVVDAQLSLSWARLATFDQAGAHRAAVAARDLDPMSPVGWLAIAWVARLDRRWADVIENCREALWMAPDHPDATFLLGEAHLQLGRREQGREILRSLRDDDRAARLLHETEVRRVGATVGVMVAVVFALIGASTGSIGLVVLPLVMAYLFRQRLDRFAHHRRRAAGGRPEPTSLVHPMLLWGTMAVLVCAVMALLT
ncbi:MAG: tetratricopeptide repeat protein [Acidimicrobiales bacterium]|nr:tetratricopeptide repeat protein [Acidimicrobiales bacterium]